jgi:hypothetical protein
MVHEKLCAILVCISKSGERDNRRPDARRRSSAPNCKPETPPTGARKPARLRVETTTFHLALWSGRRDWNQRPSPWQGGGIRPIRSGRSPGLRFRPPSFQWVQPIRRCSRARYYDVGCGDCVRLLHNAGVSRVELAPSSRPNHPPGWRFSPRKVMLGVDCPHFEIQADCDLLPRPWAVVSQVATDRPCLENSIGLLFARPQRRA